MNSTSLVIRDKLGEILEKFRSFSEGSFDERGSVHPLLSQNRKIKELMASLKERLDEREIRQSYLKHVIVTLESHLPEDERQFLSPHLVCIHRCAEIFYKIFSWENQPERTKTPLSQPVLKFIQESLQKALQSKDGKTVRHLCSQIDLRILPDAQANDLLLFAYVYGDFQVLDSILTSFRIGDASVAAIIDFAFQNHKMDQVIESLIFYHLEKIDFERKEKIAKYLATPRLEIEPRISNAEKASLLYQTIAQGVRDSNLEEIQKCLQVEEINELSTRQINTLLHLSLDKEETEPLRLLLVHDSFKNCDRKFLFLEILKLIQKNEFEKVEILRGIPSFERLPEKERGDLETLMKSCREKTICFSK